MKRLVTIFFTGLLSLQLSAQEQLPEQITLDTKCDTNSVINFKPADNMFYLTYKDNQQTAQNLQHLISQHLEQIVSGNIFIKVNGYCNSYNNEKENILAAKERSNRVKSFFIINQKLQEKNFITRNSTKAPNGKGDFVRISYFVKNKSLLYRDTAGIKIGGATPREVSAPDTNCNQEQVSENESEPPLFVVVEPPVIFAQDSLKEEPTTSAKKSNKFIFALKTNLLFDAVLAPNIEVEFPLGKRWSVSAEYTFPWWLSKDNSKAMQMLSGGVEGRLWLGNREKHRVLCGHFVGFYTGGGIYDFRYNSKGYQGEFYIASGLSYGYGLQLNKSLNLELSLGLGYMVTDYRYYECKEDNTIRAWQNDGTYTWIGPTKAKVSLVWLLGNGSRKKGGNL